VKTSITIFLAAVLMTFLSSDANLFAKSTSDDLNVSFYVSSNNYYYPGDKVSVNLYSYDYRAGKKDISKKVNFYFQIYKIKDIAGFYSNQTSRYSIDVLGRDSTNLTYLADEVGSFTKNYKPTRDYSYYYVNENVPISITENGAYFVKVSAGNQVAYCGFIITSTGVISKAGSNSMLAYVIDRKAGNPVSSADLNFYLGSRLIGKGVSSGDGTFFQEVKDEILKNDENKIPLIIGHFGNDIIISDPYLYFGYSADRFNTYIFTNQPVYRTESDVLFKGTIRRKTTTGYESYSNHEITVKIKDSRNAEVYKKVLSTNDIGSFDGSYKIDKDAPLGTYVITAQINEKNSSSINFTVEQYKKPEYKVTVTTDKNQYYGNDNLNASVEAKYFFGSPVAEADVEYNVYKVRYSKPWWAFSEWASWYEEYYASLEDNSKFHNAEYIYSGKGKLNSEGKLDFSYRIKEDFTTKNNEYYRWYYWYSYETDYKYIVQAKVVDKSRREISGLTTVFVTRGGFYLNAKSDKYLYKPGQTANIEVNANDFSDKPIQTDFSVDIYKTTWGRYDYKENRELVKTINGKTKTDGKGIISFEIPGYSAEGSYSAEVKANDERGKEIKTNAYFYVWSSEYWWSYNVSGGIQIITDKDSYKKGEVCKALIFTTIPDVNILITTETDNIIYYSVEKFTGTSKVVEFPITENYTTNFKISANFVNNGQFYTSNKSLMLIPEEKFLTVKVETSKEIYKPKEEGTLKVHVLDYEGKPVRNAEVSIGIIDESIYSIKDETTKDIRKVFYGYNFTNVSTTFNTYASNYSYSRLMTIYEKFNIRSTREGELATVKGTLLTKNDIPIANATIVIDEDYKAAITNSDGTFEFKLPEGIYSIGIYYSNLDYNGLMNISLSKSEIKTIKLYTEKTKNEITDFNQSGIVTEGSETGRLNDVSKTSAPTKHEEKKDVKMKMYKGDDEKDKSIDLKEAEVRSDFKDAIFWSPYTRTDADGYAIVNVKYPDNLTSWRVTSRVITADTKVGQMTHTVITRKNLLVRMETPRFLQDKDEVTISTIIHNYLSTEKNVKVKFKATNVSLVGENEKQISIASNSEKRLDWNIKVNNPYGEAKLYAEALTNEESDAVELKVPLQPKGLEIVQPLIADYSENNVSEKKYIDIPMGTDIRSAGLKFTVAPSLASTILSSLDELAGYPYGCVEQTMSRFLPTVVVASAFKDLNAPISEATQKDLPKMVDAGIKRLYGFQHSDGGWGWWTNDATNPFMTAYVVYGLSIAKTAGYEIRSDVVSKGITSMKNSLKSTTDPTTKAYILYSIAIADSKEIEKYKYELDKLLEEDINDYARSLIAMTYNIMGNSDMALKVVNDLETRVKSTGESGAYWEGKSFHYNWQDDKVQTTAMGLKALVNIKGSSDLKNKIIRWLMMQRMGFGWRNTQETAIIIYSMVDYLKNSQELSPDYNVKIFVNGEKYYEKRMTKNDIFLKDSLIKIPGSKLKEGKNEIRIDKEGAGKVYFSANTSYYWDTENISPREEGFRVEKEYYKLEKYESYNSQNITFRKKYFDGNAKSGDMILVKIRVYSKENNMNFFMLEDPIPAGCEVTKDDWAYKVEDEKDYSGYSYYWWRWWYADKDIRDNKVTFFATYMYGNSYEFSYIMRAQIPGDYNVNPAKGCLMYYTDVSGSTPNMKLHIED
jgi:alpha-2-macroglobulin